MIDSKKANEGEPSDKPVLRRTKREPKPCTKHKDSLVDSEIEGLETPNFKNKSAAPA